MNLLKKYYFYISIFVINLFIPLRLIHACVGGEPTLVEKLFNLLFLPFIIAISILFFKKIERKKTLIIFIILYTLFVLVLWSMFSMVTKTFC